MKVIHTSEKVREMMDFNEKAVNAIELVAKGLSENAKALNSIAEALRASNTRKNNKNDVISEKNIEGAFCALAKMEDALNTYTSNFIKNQG